MNVFTALKGAHFYILLVERKKESKRENNRINRMKEEKERTKIAVGLDSEKRIVSEKMRKDAKRAYSRFAEFQTRPKSFIKLPHRSEG